MSDYNSRYTGEQIDEGVGIALAGAVVSSAQATTLAEGSAATATIEAGVLKLGIPAGKTGPQGPDGPQGPAYTLNDTDKNTIAAAVKDSLKTETWTFTLEDDSTVAKVVYVG